LKLSNAFDVDQRDDFDIYRTLTLHPIKKLKPKLVSERMEKETPLSKMDMSIQ
jgi:hypothetical protein